MSSNENFPFETFHLKYKQWFLRKRRCAESELNVMETEFDIEMGLRKSKEIIGSFKVYLRKFHE